ncbi:UNVERIFIED_CONTAM: hypothetical protein K2H54_000008 [Gekko kuhli]
MEAKARWNRLNAATLDLAQEAGLFAKEARAEFESEWYIPFFRESDDGDVIAPFKPKGIANQNAGIKKLKGGEANTADLLENIFTSTSKLIDASMKNMAAQKTVWNLVDTGIIEVVAKPNMMDWRALKNGKDLITVKLEGEDYMIRVEDPDLYRAMTFFDRQPFGSIVNMASKAKRLLTAGVTASPEFMLRNFLRDSLSSWAISKDGFKPVIDSIKGVKKTLAMEGSTIDVMFSGASFLGGYVNGNDPTAMADTVRKSLRRKGMTPEQIAKYEKSIIRNAAHAKGVVADVWEKYSRFGEAFENGNREAVYDAAIKSGKSHAQAAFEAKDLMDFSMLGASRTMQVMVQVLPFFNARCRGLPITGTMSAMRRCRIGTRTATGISSLVISIGGSPKPFEIGVLFGTIPERMTRRVGKLAADEIPLVKAVYRGTGPAKSTQHMEEFYRMLTEVNQLKRTVDQYRSEGLTEKANELLDEQGGILKSRRSLSRTQQQVRVVRNKIELIQRDRTMNAEEKRRRIDEMLARRNDLVYQAVNKNKANWE